MSALKNYLVKWLYNKFMCKEMTRFNVVQSGVEPFAADNSGDNNYSVISWRFFD